MSQFWYQRITDSDNDAEEAFNYRTIGNQADFHENECLFRFVNSPIPAGSTIVACKITFTARQTSSGSLVVDWHCEDADDSAVPTDVAGVVTDRTLTTASVEWDIPAFADDATYDTPDLTDCLQEVIDRAGWDAGNAVSFITANIVGTAERGASMSDFSTAESALLTVEYEPPASSGEIDVQVGAALDDVEEDTADGHMTMNASKLEANVKVVGLRFLSIAVPQGAIITSATLSVYANGSTASGATMTVKAIDEDDCAAFDTSPYNVSGRDLVGNVAWAPAAWTSGMQYVSTDISAAVQQVILRPGWSSGNALGLAILVGSGAAKGFDSWNKNPEHAALLHLTFEEDSSEAAIDHGESWAVVAAETVVGLATTDYGESYATVAAQITEPTQNTAAVDNGETWAIVRPNISYNLELSEEGDSWAVVIAGYDWITVLADPNDSYAVVAAQAVALSNAILAAPGESYATVAVETVQISDSAALDPSESYATVVAETTTGLTPSDSLAGVPIVAAAVWQLDSFFKELFGS